MAFGRPVGSRGIAIPAMSLYPSGLITVGHLEMKGLLQLLSWSMVRVLRHIQVLPHTAYRVLPPPGLRSGLRGRGGLFTALVQQATLSLYLLPQSPEKDDADARGGDQSVAS